MKQLTCEMCGSHDLVKQDGVFVCQTCGTKYSIEEAKKMMVEGTVEVSGTVKVDSSDELANLYQIARRAKDGQNSEDAMKYYSMILVKDPNSWEASFYVVYFRAMGCKIANIKSAANSVNNCLVSVFRLIKDHVPEKAEREKAIYEVSLRCTVISSSLFDAAQNYYKGLPSQVQSNFRLEMVNRCIGALNIMYTLGNSIDFFFPDEEAFHKYAVVAWKDAIEKNNSLLVYIYDKEERLHQREFLEKMARNVQKYDSSYQAPEMKTGGCYVATAVYGSYDCPQVWTLRRFRDYTLAKTWYGRAFIRTYYAISPTLVKWFGHTEWFQRMWRGPLDRMVSNLQATGVESTPYDDQPW